MNNKINNKNFIKMSDYDIIAMYNKSKHSNVKNSVLLHLYKKYNNVMYSVYKKYSFLKNYYEFEDYKQDAFLILINAIEYYSKGDNEKYSFGILFKWLLNNHCKKILNQEFVYQPDEISEFEPAKINIENEIILNETINQKFSYHFDFEKIKNIISDLKHFNKNEICKMYNVNYYYLNNILCNLKK